MIGASGNSTTKNETNDFLSSIFNKTNAIFIIVFLGIYLVAYFILGYFFNNGTNSSSFELRLSRTLDIIFLVILLLIFGTFLVSYNDTQKESVFSSTYNSTASFVDEKYSIVTVGIILVLFYFIVYLFRIPMTRETKPIFISFIETIIWIFLVIILFIDFFKYFLNVSVVDKAASIKIPDKPITTVVVDQKVTNRAFVKDDQQEVFNVDNNLYTYDDAQSICQAYGAKLATYDQVEDAYNHGGEWCNYGWSAGQMALFPTQKETWKKLQGTKGHENDCGRPGVNGGYIENPYVEFGVNCFGKKPKPSADDLERMKKHQQIVVPMSDKDKELNAKVQFWKENAANLIKLNSYNDNSWSEY